MILKIVHFLLHWPSFHTPKQTLLNNIRNVKKQTLSSFFRYQFYSKDLLIQKFLYCNPTSDKISSDTKLELHTKSVYNEKN